MRGRGEEQAWRDWISNSRQSNGWVIGARWMEPAPKRAPRPRFQEIRRLVASMRRALTR